MPFGQGLPMLPMFGFDGDDPSSRRARELMAVISAQLAMKEAEKFEVSGDLKDIESAISGMRCAAMRAEDDDSRSAFLNRVGDYWHAKFQKTRTDSDFETSIANSREAIDLRPKGDQQRAAWLAELAGRLNDRQEETGKAKDVRQLATCLEQMAEEADSNASNWKRLVKNVVICRSRLFRQTFEARDIDFGIKWCCNVLLGFRRARSQDQSRIVLLESLLDLIDVKSRQIKSQSDIDLFLTTWNEYNGLAQPDRKKSLFYLADLADMQRWKHKQTGAGSDLDDLIATYRSMIPLTRLEDGRQRNNILDMLSGLLCQRYGTTKDLKLLEESLKWSNMAWEEMCVDEDAEQVVLNTLLHNVVHKHTLLYAARNDIENLNSAVKLQRQLAHTSPAKMGNGPENKATSFYNLGKMLWDRFKRTDEVEDLTEAVEAFETSIQDIPRGHSERKVVFEMLVPALETLFQRLNKPAYRARAKDLRLEQEGSKEMEAKLTFDKFQTSRSLADLNSDLENINHQVTDIASDDPNWTVTYSNAATLHWQRFEATGSRDDMDKTIKLLRNIIEKSTDKDPYVASLLAVALVWRSKLNANQAEDLRDAELWASHAERLAHEAESTDAALYSCNIGQFYAVKFDVSENVQDLDEAIRWYEKGVAAKEQADTSFRELSNMAAICMKKFNVTQNIEDLEEALGWAEETKGAVPNDAPERSTVLSNLSQILLARYQQTINTSDLDQAITVAQDALSSAAGISNRWMRLNSLAMALLERGNRTRNESDIRSGIELLSEALDETPEDHPERPTIRHNLDAAKKQTFVQTPGALAPEALLAAMGFTDEPSDQSNSLSGLMQMLLFGAPEDQDAQGEVPFSSRGKDVTLGQPSRVVELEDTDSDIGDVTDQISAVALHSQVAAGELDSTAETVAQGSRNAKSLDPDFTLNYSKSKKWWGDVQRAQLLHVTASARCEEDLLLCTFFWKYLESADENDLPKLPNGEPFPVRPWILLRDHLISKGTPMTAAEEHSMRVEEEDHPKIKEWLGTNYGWHEELFGAEIWAKRLCQYSPYRREK